MNLERLLELWSFSSLVHFAIGWFATDETLVEEARWVLTEIGHEPLEVVVRDPFVNDLSPVLIHLSEGRTLVVQKASELVDELGIASIWNGHQLLAPAAEFASLWRFLGYDLVYAVIAGVSDGLWLTSDVRAARRIHQPGLVRVLGA